MIKLFIEGIEIEVQKKKIKNLNISVVAPQGIVRVSAPIRMSDIEIRNFVLTKIAWIKKHQEKFQNRPKEPELQYVSGEKLCLWNKSYTLEVVHSNKCNDVRIEEEIIVMQTRETSTLDQRAKILDEWYRKNIKREIPYLIEKWQKIIGVVSPDWGVKDMKTRWGTCNIRDKRIWINLQLVKKHPLCLEYIVVHELVHFLEKKHDKVFYGYMDKFLPEWKRIKTLL